MEEKKELDNEVELPEIVEKLPTGTFTFENSDFDLEESIKDIE